MIWYWIVRNRDAEERKKLEDQFSEAEASDKLRRASKHLPPVPAVPVDQLTPEERRRKLLAARPNWGTPEQHAAQNMAAASMLGASPLSGGGGQ